MSSFRRVDEILAAYEDHVEALEHMFHARAAHAADPRSRLHQLTDAAIQVRLGQDREELDRWVVMMLVASFEATIRADALDRIQARTPDAVRRPLRDLYAKGKDRVRLDDLLAIWEAHAAVGATVKQNTRTVLKHRHWLAHGRRWTNKYGAFPTPHDVYAYLDDYQQTLRLSQIDYPRG